MALIGPGTSDPTVEVPPEVVAAELGGADVDEDEDELLLLLLLLPHPAIATPQINGIRATDQLLRVRILSSFVDTPRGAAYATAGLLG
ncbi:MAG: hypothetical protein ACR2MK_11865 [Solirubrobacteraceae bacterium]